MFVWNVMLTVLKDNANLEMIKIHVYNVMQIYFLIHLHKGVLKHNNVPIDIKVLNIELS